MNIYRSTPKVILKIKLLGKQVKICKTNIKDLAMISLPLIYIKLYAEFRICSL